MLGVTLALVAAIAGDPAAQASGDDPVLLEFHFDPVPDLQIAIWLEDGDGNHVQDVMVTQATGRLGIGNRPGRWDFLSSWRFPYGPRPQVLPIWGHRRGGSYPALTFHDSDTSDLESLGWHENTSSAEPYYCRPLTESEHNTISVDSMTCPSPATFRSDKGRFTSARSVYPPRNDLSGFDAQRDHPDVRMFGELNDLDAITRATPRGNGDTVITATVPAALARSGELSAWIEVNLEGDQNANWSFKREEDHYVDPRLSGYGIAYIGQPSVAFRLDFNPMQVGFTGTTEYAGYGSWNGQNGDLNAPDNTINEHNGSGADRLRVQTQNGETFRFGVFSHGQTGGEPPEGTTGDGGEDPWGECMLMQLPPAQDVVLEAISFDRVGVELSLPQDIPGGEIAAVRLHYTTNAEPLTDDNLGSALEFEAECDDTLAPGARVRCELPQLFGNHTYQVADTYEDVCANRSSPSGSMITTPAQEFATVEGFCFVATAAYGGAWAKQVPHMRWFRDRVLRKTVVGELMVQTYYRYSPTVAGLIAQSSVARAAARRTLAPLANVASISVLSR